MLIYRHVKATTERTATMKNVTTLYVTDENEYGDIQDYEIDVDTDWLKNEIIEDFGFSTIEEFMDEYTSDESSEVYCIASITGHLVRICPC